MRSHVKRVVPTPVNDYFIAFILLIYSKCVAFAPPKLLRKSAATCYISFPTTGNHARRQLHDRRARRSRRLLSRFVLGQRVILVHTAVSAARPD